MPSWCTLHGRYHWYAACGQTAEERQTRRAERVRIATEAARWTRDGQRNEEEQT